MGSGITLQLIPENYGIGGNTVRVFTGSALVLALSSELWSSARWSCEEGRGGGDIDIPDTLCNMIEKMTGITPDMDSTLDEVGLASVDVPIIIGMLNSAFSTKSNPLSITSADLVEAKTIEDMCVVVEGARARMEQDGI